MHDLAWAVLGGVVGLAIGSFLSVVVERVPAGASVVSPRSRCPQCQAQLRTADNIPVVSYVLLRGRCRGCGTPIPARYPLLELTTGLAFAAIFWVQGSWYIAVMSCALAALLIAVGWIDLEHRIIPNRLTYPAIVVFAVVIVVGWAFGEPIDPARAAIGLVVYGGGLLLVALLSPRGMGMGDVKLGALIGLVLGSLGLRYVAVAAAVAVLGGGLGAGAALLVGKGRKGQIPFGPFLAAGGIVALVWGAWLAAWYLQILA
jgi:leader peptidase (prepilin peptidase)/N-methyltransferase